MKRPAVVAGYALLGSTWLILKTEGALQQMMREKATMLGMITLGKNKPILKNVSALFCCHHHSTLYFLLCPSVGHCWQVC